MDCMEPFHLEFYGNWGAEMRELRERLGWAKADEAGKFYSHQGDNTWYYSNSACLAETQYDWQGGKHDGR
jgi:hypothetical protein